MKRSHFLSIALLLGLSLGVLMLLTLNRPSEAAPLEAAAVHPWQALPAAAGPGPRTGHTMVSINGDIYLFGGLNMTGTLNDLWMFDGQSWQEINAANPPPDRRGHAATVSGGQMLVYGGLSSDLQNLGDLWRYNPGDSTWTELTPSGSRPQARTTHSLATLGDGNAYLLGGAGDYPLIDQWQYDPGANTWTKKASFPGAHVYGITMVPFGGDGYLLDLSPAQPWIYDPVQNQWSGGTMQQASASLTAALPPPRIYAAVAWSGSRAWLFGGEDWNTYDTLSDAWEYNFATQTWTQWPDLPTAIKFARAAVVGAPETGIQIMVYGGLRSDYTLNDETFLFTPPCAALSEAALDGPSATTVGVTAAFTAAVSPPTATLPVTYTWQASGQAPITRSGGLSDTAAFAWDVTGVQAVTVTARNECGAAVSDVQTLTVEAGKWYIYLPLVRRE